jgi:hypothetical protein
MPGLSRTPSLDAVRVKWRFGLVAIIAAAVVGGFMPHGVISGTQINASEIVQIAEVPLALPLHCLDATCGKGSPAPAAPTPAIALAAVLAAFAVVAAFGAAFRRHKTQTASLPSGARVPLFHPPQFS